MKWCSGCKTEKRVSEFGKNRSTKDGMQGWCKSCRAEHSREFYRSHKREIIKQQRGYNPTPAGRESQSRNGKNQRLRYPEKIKARMAVSNAIRDGRLLRPDTCENCGEGKFVHGHHEDYINKPLDVEWLCIECHTELHRKEQT